MLQAFLQELRGFDSSPRSLRSFGILVGAILTLLAAWLIWRSDPPALTTFVRGGRPSVPVVFGIVGIGLIGFGLFAPRLLRPLYMIWMTLALILGAVMSRVVLTTVFALMITPIGLVMRLFGRDPLRRKYEAGDSSYWISRDDMDRSPERLEKYY